NGQTLPCATQVTGGTVGGVANTTPYHSIAVSFGTLNITPLTDLVVAQLTGTTPATWFGSPVFTTVNSTALNAAINTVSTNLGLTSTLGSTNPFTTAFAANNGVLLDDVLEAMKTTLSNAAVNKTYAELLAAAAANNFSTFSGFSGTFGTIYVNLAPATPSGATSCTTGQILMTYDGTAGKFTKGQGVCFTGTASTLAFSGKSLTSPVKNTAVTSPYTAYTFTDASDGYVYELIFNVGDIYEINVSKGSGANDFDGQFTPSTSSSTGGTASGTGTLTIETTVVGTSTTIVVNGVTKPSTQTEFCSFAQNDSSTTALKANGGSLTINSCTFSGSVGNISATLAITSPVAFSTSYTIKYTYN
ncbi:MAG: hypothetical protein HXX19_14080, partial [Rhodoferax sp.]|nr:hypothetical protein [Rhodoferax sp.]